MLIQRRVRNRQRGAAAVEFALVLPILMTLVMGAIDWGWYFYVDQLVTNAAREGARAGSVVSPPPTGSQSLAVSTAKTASETFLTNVKLSATGVTSSWNADVGAVQVEILYPVGSKTGFLGGLLPTYAHAISVMRWP